MSFAEQVEDPKYPATEVERQEMCCVATLWLKLFHTNQSQMTDSEDISWANWSFMTLQH